MLCMEIMALIRQKIELLKVILGGTLKALRYRGLM
jgi:hypothetical protein